MKVLIDLIWGGLIISACTLVLVYFVLSRNSNLLMVAMILFSGAAAIHLSEEYEKKKRNEYNNRFKR